jgi:hypothetical protein
MPWNNTLDDLKRYGPKPRRVFISHATEDGAIAHRLADDLRRMGLTVWIAPESIRAGEGWVRAIERGLGESDVLVVLLTPAAVQSRWVNKEMEVAIGLERHGQMDIIPLSVRTCTPPLLWSSYQCVPFSHYTTGLERLVATLSSSPAPAAAKPRATPPTQTTAGESTESMPQLPPSRAGGPRKLTRRQVLLLAGGGAAIVGGTVGSVLLSRCAVPVTPTATAAPTGMATPEPTATATFTATGASPASISTASATGAALATPSHITGQKAIITRVPTSTLAATVAPTPGATSYAAPRPLSACSVPVGSAFSAMWNQGRLGCPVSPPTVAWSAWQTFDDGYLLWRGDSNHVLALFRHDSSWREYTDQWDEGMAIRSRGSPPPNRQAPERGFGYLWGRYDELFGGLGWATEAEMGFCAELQVFEKGFILRSHTVMSCSYDKRQMTTPGHFPSFTIIVYNNGAWAYQ